MLEKKNPISSFTESLPTNDLTGSLLLIVLLPFVFVLWLISLSLELFLQVIISVIKLLFQMIGSFLHVRKEGGITVSSQTVVSPQEDTYMQGKIEDLHSSFNALERLFRLKKEGALSHEEFEQEKTKLLSKL